MADIYQAMGEVPIAGRALETSRAARGGEALKHRPIQSATDAPQPGAQKMQKQTSRILQEQEGTTPSGIAAELVPTQSQAQARRKTKQLLDIGSSLAQASPKTAFGGFGGQTAPQFTPAKAAVPGRKLQSKLSEEPMEWEPSFAQLPLAAKQKPVEAAPQQQQQVREVEQSFAEEEEGEEGMMALQIPEGGSASDVTQSYAAPTSQQIQQSRSQAQPSIGGIVIPSIAQSSAQQQQLIAPSRPQLQAITSSIAQPRQQASIPQPQQSIAQSRPQQQQPVAQPIAAPPAALPIVQSSLAQGPPVLQQAKGGVQPTEKQANEMINLVSNPVFAQEFIRHYIKDDISGSSATIKNYADTEISKVKGAVVEQKGRVDRVELALQTTGLMQEATDAKGVKTIISPLGIEVKTMEKGITGLQKETADIRLGAESLVSMLELNKVLGRDEQNQLAAMELVDNRARALLEKNIGAFQQARILGEQDEVYEMARSSEVQALRTDMESKNTDLESKIKAIPAPSTDQNLLTLIQQAKAGAVTDITETLKAKYLEADSIRETFKEIAKVTGSHAEIINGHGTTLSAEITERKAQYDAIALKMSKLGESFEQTYVAPVKKDLEALTLRVNTATAPVVIGAPPVDDARIQSLDLKLQNHTLEIQQEKVNTTDLNDRLTAAAETIAKLDATLNGDPVDGTWKKWGSDATAQLKGLDTDMKELKTFKGTIEKQSTTMDETIVKLGANVKTVSDDIDLYQESMDRSLLGLQKVDETLRKSIAAAEERVLKLETRPISVVKVEAPTIEEHRALSGKVTMLETEGTSIKRRVGEVETGYADADRAIIGDVTKLTNDLGAIKLKQTGDKSELAKAIEDSATKIYQKIADETKRLGAKLDVFSPNQTYTDDLLGKAQRGADDAVSRLDVTLRRLIPQKPNPGQGGDVTINPQQITDLRRDLKGVVDNLDADYKPKFSDFEARLVALQQYADDPIKVKTEFTAVRDELSRAVTELKRDYEAKSAHEQDIIALRQVDSDLNRTDDAISKGYQDADLALQQRFEASMRSKISTATSEIIAAAEKRMQEERTKLITITVPQIAEAAIRVYVQQQLLATEARVRDIVRELLPPPVTPQPATTQQQIVDAVVADMSRGTNSVVAPLVVNAGQPAINKLDVRIGTLEGKVTITPAEVDTKISQIQFPPQMTTTTVEGIVDGKIRQIQFPAQLSRPDVEGIVDSKLAPVSSAIPTVQNMTNLVTPLIAQSVNPLSTRVQVLELAKATAPAPIQIQGGTPVVGLTQQELTNALALYVPKTEMDSMLNALPQQLTVPQITQSLLSTFATPLQVGNAIQTAIANIPKAPVAAVQAVAPVQAAPVIPQGTFVTPAAMTQAIQTAIANIPKAPVAAVQAVAPVQAAPVIPQGTFVTPAAMTQAIQTAIANIPKVPAPAVQGQAAAPAVASLQVPQIIQALTNANAFATPAAVTTAIQAAGFVTPTQMAQAIQAAPFATPKQVQLAISNILAVPQPQAAQVQVQAAAAAQLTPQQMQYLGNTFVTKVLHNVTLTRLGAVETKIAGPPWATPTQVQQMIAAAPKQTVVAAPQVQQAPPTAVQQQQQATPPVQQQAVAPTAVTPPPPAQQQQQQAVVAAQAQQQTPQIYPAGIDIPHDIVAPGSLKAEMLSDKCIKDKPSDRPEGCNPKNTDACETGREADQGLCNFMTIEVPVDDEVGSGAQFSVYRGVSDVGTRIKLQLHKARVFSITGDMSSSYKHLWNARKLASNHTGAVGSGIPSEGSRFLRPQDMEILGSMPTAGSRPIMKKYVADHNSFDGAAYYKRVLGGDTQIAADVTKFFDKMRKS